MAISSTSSSMERYSFLFRSSTYFFYKMYYLQDFVPDFVLVGKHWGYGYLFHLDYEHVQSRRDPATIKSLRGVNGVVTSAIDNRIILFTITILKIVLSEGLLDKIRVMGSKFKNYLGSEAERMYALKSNQRYNKGKNPYTIRGIGGLFYTDLHFGGNISSDNIEFNRIILKFDCDIEYLSKHMKATIK